MKNKEEWKVYGNVFSKHSLDLLFQMSTQGYFDELESTISVGKEANIFTAKNSNGRIVVKIYRLENCNFNKMYDYLVQDPRYKDLKRKSRLIVFAWTQREYRNLMLAREAIKVPKPITFKDNIVLMEFIGDNEFASRELKDAPPKDPEKFFKKIIDNMRKLFKKGLIHGDLSPFNILNHDEEPVFIDFSQGTMTTASNAKELLRRDVKNICTHFRKFFKITEDEEEKIYNKIVGKK